MKMEQMKFVVSILGIISLAACSPNLPVKPTGSVSNIMNETTVLASAPICRSVRSTFFGGAETNRMTSIRAIAIGNDDHVYIAGTTDSPSLPGTLNHFQPNIDPETSNGAFVAEFSADLRTLIAATYVGRANMLQPVSLAIGKEGQIYVAGEKVRGHAFIAKLTPDLTKEQSFISARAGPIRAMTIASNGNLYIAGGGSSFGSSSAYSYVAELTSNLKLLQQNAYLGGSGKNWATAIAIGPDGYVYVAGDTSSTDFPKMLGGAQSKFSGRSDAFVVKLSSDLGQIIQATYFGGNRGTAATALAVGQQGQVYVTGYTSASDLLGTNGAAQPAPVSSDNAYVTELSSDLKSVVHTTYVGGRGDDTAWTMAVSNDDQIYIAGMTDSSDFPGVTGGVQEDIARGRKHGFVSEISTDLRRIIQSSYYIGTRRGGEDIRGIAFGANRYLYVAGNTRSTSLPCDQLGALTTLSSKWDSGFVARYPNNLRKRSENEVH